MLRISAAILATTFAAAAQEKKAPAPPPKAKPDLALTTAFKDAVGRWRCTSTMILPADMGGGELKTRSQITIRRELGGFAYSGDYRMQKSKAFPGIRGRILWTYDPNSKKFLELAADDSGGVVRGESDGMQGGTMVWSEDGVMMGKPTKMRTTIVMKGKRDMEVQVETIGTLGQASPLGTDRCKKG